jgi:predicted nucleotide-binding protein
MEAVLIAPGHIEKTIIGPIRTALEKADVKLKTPLDYAPPSVSALDFITDVLTSADLVIADISEGNPNVLYELGYAHALRKNTILLVNRDAQPKIPSDLAGVLFLTYDPANLEELGSLIVRQVNVFKRRREALLAV